MGRKHKVRRAPQPGGPLPARNPRLWISRDILWAALLLCALIAVYWPALQGGLLMDDPGHVTRPELRTWEGFKRIWVEPGAATQYYPLLHTAFWIEHKLWGDAVAGYHLANLIQHWLAAILLALLARRLEIPGAWLAGSLFALHPVCVEAVAWISEQKSTLSAVLYLSAALAYLRYERGRRKQWYFLSTALFVLALACKTVTAALPAALLVVSWWRRGRLEWMRDVAPLLPWFGLGMGAGLTTVWVEREFIGASGPEFHLSLVERCLIAGRAVWFYLGKLFWPANLCFSYPRWQIDAGDWRQYLWPAALLAAAAGLWLLARRRRGPLAAFLLYTGTLFPALGFFNVYPFLYSFVADHYQYLASATVCAAAGGAISSLAQRTLRSARWGSLVAILPLIPLAGLSGQQAVKYADAETLYRSVLACNPESWMAHNNLGRELLNQPGRLEEAELHFRETMRLRPGLYMPHYNLGTLYERIPGRLADAVAEYQEALRIEPRFAPAHDALGKLLAAQGRYDEAVAHFGEAARLLPDDARVHNNLGAALAKAGRPAEAIPHFDAAVRLHPGFAEAYGNRGLALASQGRLEEAVKAFEEALRLEPQSERYRRLLARVREQLRQQR